MVEMTSAPFQPFQSDSSTFAGLTVPVSGDDMQLPLHDDSDAVAEMLSRARSPLEYDYML